MYRACLEDLDRIQEAVRSSGKQFMYAENFVYAPAIQKAAEIIAAKKSRILYMKGEESLKGSSSAVAGEWAKTGGGTFIRTGTHPLLRHFVAQAAGGPGVRPGNPGAKRTGGHGLRDAGTDCL